MKVLVISGFLGAGKTTFIRELLKHTTRYTAVLENEFGEIDLDSRDISASSKDAGLQVLEFSEGCVCCSKKDSFIYSVLTISSGIDPEYLIVEPSGIARLGNIMAGLEKIRYEKIDPIKPAVIISLPNYFLNLQDHRELMENQVRNAGYAVYSKGAGVDPDIIEEVSRSIRSLNPDIQIAGLYGPETPEEWWKQFFREEGSSRGSGRYTEEYGADGFEQMGITDLEFGSLGELAAFCEEIVRGRYRSIARVKGTACAGGQTCRVDIADNSYVITGGTAPLQMVFIGKNIDRIRLYRRCKKDLRLGFMSAERSDKGQKKIRRHP